MTLEEAERRIEALETALADLLGDGYVSRRDETRTKQAIEAVRQQDKNRRDPGGER